MKNRTFPCLPIIFSIWIGLFAPFISAQTSDIKGLLFTISEALIKPTGKVEKPPNEVEELNQKETNDILKRLPAMPDESKDAENFKMLGDTIRPPKTGNIIPIKFPDDENQMPPALLETTTKPLRVQRFTPNGKASLITDLNVTFSQPMVAVSRQSTASETVPVKLSPKVEGKWRWLGTNTLTFDAKSRFPMATTFTATIPKGTKSAIGGVLEKDISWTFTTPPPKVEMFVPRKEIYEMLPKHILMGAKFNQEIDKAAILTKIKVFVGKKQFQIKSFTPESNRGYVPLGRLGEVKAKHWIGFKTIKELPRNSDVKVVFEKGLPSAEGSALSTKKQTFTFKTLTPFRLAETFCGYKRANKPCEPSDNFRLRFNHSRYPDKLDTSLIKIEPKIKNLEITTDGSNSLIFINGIKKPNTTYKVTVSGKMIDYYKQPLGEDVTVIFNVGIEKPRFIGDGEGFVTLDPNGKLRYSIYTRNHNSFKVRLYAVTPADYPKFRQLMYDFRNNRRVIPTPNFGELVFDKTIKVKAKTDFYEETQIDLRKAIPNKFGHVFLIAEPTVKNKEYNPRNLPILTWIQSTNIGVDAFSDYEKLVTFTTDLKTAKPLKNLEITLNKETKLTDETGIAEFMFKESVAYGFVTAKNGKDSAILSESKPYYYSYTNWRKNTLYDTLRWFVFDDRKMYRPNEEVSIKGYLRKVTGGKFTDIAELGNKAKSVLYIIKDQRGNELKKERIKLNAFGAFDFKFNLPRNGNLGYHRIEFWAQENPQGSPNFVHSFQVQEFRRPEFEVKTKVETNAPFIVGKKALISATANYYSGGFLKDAPINWTVTSTSASYTPPNRDDFIFGKFIAWWRKSRNVYIRGNTERISGKTNTDGKHNINLDLEKANPARPYTIRAEANVQDVNRQNIASATNLLIHPSNLYVGIRTTRNFVEPNEKLKLETITTDIDGKAVANAKVSIKAELHDYKYVASNWKKTLIDTQTCEINSTETVASCEIYAKQGGTFTITARVLDEKERPNESELTVWVAGANAEVTDQVEQENVEIIPSKKDYSAGETAEILVNAPFFPAEGVMTLRRNGIVKTERFTMSGSSKILQIPIEEKYLPNIHVQVNLVGVVKRNLYEDKRDKKIPKRPAYASGDINLNVSAETRNLKVNVEPMVQTLEPGGKTKINLDIKNFNGKAVANSEVAVIAVDEGILALTNYKINNPLNAFYTKISPNVKDFHSRENLLLYYPDDFGTGFGYGSGFGNGSGRRDPFSKPQYSTSDIALQSVSASKSSQNNFTRDGIDSSEAIKLRKNFNALAIFSPTVVTDENGKATVDLKLPDNLTRYRITAVAVTKSKQFGTGESAITAKTSLQIRPSAPRFMNFGDKAELPVVLQNQTDSPMTMNVAIRSQNANLPNSKGKKVTIPANDRAEVRFPVSTEKAGMARFQIGAVSGEFTDAAEIVLPVYTPATSEAFATYGTTEANGTIVQNISAPENVFKDFGGLEVTTSSTQLQELTDAFIYLQSYQFACSEQIASRVLSVAAVRDVLSAFKAENMPSEERIEAKMQADIMRLQTLQNNDGGFSFWRYNDKSVPYVAVHIAHALARAKAKGYKVPNQMIRNSLRYLKNIEKKYPKTYSEKSKWAISSYALYVRNLLDKKDIKKAKKLLNDVSVEELSIESSGWLLSVFADDKDSLNEIKTIKQHLLNRVTETAGNAHFVTNYSDGEYVLLSSKRRADGVILEAVLKAESREAGVENSELKTLIPKIVRGLLAHREKGRWQNTQENAFVLLALDKYFQTYEKTTPNFVAKMWLGNAFAGEQKFAGRSIDSQSLKVPMTYLQSNKESQKLIMDKQGDGRFYYRIGLKYAPKNLNLKSADYGFEVRRRYEAIDNEDDVTQNADGSWAIKTGARIRVNIKMVAPTRRYHVALVDNLPAGIEIINTALATASRNNYSRNRKRNSYWFNYQNLRDNRAEAFTTLLHEGVWNYSYLGRATTPGEFIVPPAKAEEMYSPETFGRSKTDIVKIK